MATYRWQTLIFRGGTPDEATRAFDEWFGYGTKDWTITRPGIRQMANGALYYHLSHVPTMDGYELHVTALVATEQP